MFQTHMHENHRNYLAVGLEKMETHQEQQVLCTHRYTYMYTVYKMHTNMAP